MGRHDEALVEIERALELDRFSLIINTLVGWTHFNRHEYERSAEQCRKTLEMEPDFGPAQECLVLSYVMSNRGEEAVQAMERFPVGPGDDPGLGQEARRAYETGGTRGLWELRLRQTQEEAKHRFVSPVEFAEVYAQLGEIDRAIAELEKAYEEHEAEIIYLKRWPLYDPLRGDPRFQALIRKVKLPED